MDGSIFLFRLLGVYFVMMGFLYAFRRRSLISVYEDFYRVPGVMFLAGLITMIAGLSLVLNYQVWEWSAKGFVSGLGWWIFIKGALLLYYPNWGKGWAQDMMRGNLPYLFSLISIGLGGWLLYHGFYEVAV